MARPYNQLVSVAEACLGRARSADFIAATVLLKMLESKRGLLPTAYQP